MTVTEYEREFVRLSRYAWECVSTKAIMCKRFEDGLNKDIKLLVKILEIKEFVVLVERACKAEELGKKKRKADFEARDSRKRLLNKSFQSALKKLRDDFSCSKATQDTVQNTRSSTTVAKGRPPKSMGNVSGSQKGTKDTTARSEARAPAKAYAIRARKEASSPDVIIGTFTLYDTTEVKVEHQVSSGLLQPIMIPEWKWDRITMDFVLGLPLSSSKEDAIWVVVDRLTKSAHFISVHTGYSFDKLADLYIYRVVRLHKVPISIILDRDSRFTSHFWKKLQDTLGIKLHFSAAFHSQTDGQSKWIIQILEDMLRCCILEFKGMWE
ncbi:uncharacterized protein LOC105787004 [Gossypium raimondii]|uniref:uncharacterized protein LOC105787004 n=1 Tax=Gossypium raimondii TaxID=29730 RepID=UPI00063AF1DB|nr:uncharacterized protein LOC105787004 [Gossypium raimondii]